MSALTRNRTTATVPNEIMRQYYEQRAVGGAGLIVSEGTLITRQGCLEFSLLPYARANTDIKDPNGRMRLEFGTKLRSKDTEGSPIPFMPTVAKYTARFVV